MNPIKAKSCWQWGYLRAVSLGTSGMNIKDGQLPGDYSSVFQRYHRLIALAESCDMLKAAVGLFQQQHGTIAENRMTSLRHVPHPTFARMVVREKIDRRAQRRCEPRAWQRQCQE